MINQQDIERCFDYLRDSAPAIANARYAKVKSEELRKVIWSEVRNTITTGPQAEKNAYAYAHKDYRDHIETMAKAAGEFQKLHAEREAAIAKIDAWRTSSANERGSWRAA